MRVTGCFVLLLVLPTVARADDGAAQPTRLPHGVEVTLSLGLGAIHSDPEIIPMCGDGDCDTPLGIMADLGVGLRVVPRLLLGVRLQLSTQVLTGDPFSDTQLDEHALLAITETRVSSRISVTGGIGIATGWYSWKQSGFIVDDSKSHSLGIGPMAAGGVRVRLGSEKRFPWAFEVRGSIAKLDQTLPGLHLLLNVF